MNAVTLLSIVIAIIFAGLAWLAIWSRRADRMRHAAVALFVLGLPVLAWASLESLSWSRPLWAMWGLSGEYRVLAAKMIEGEAIYAYIDTDGEPRSVKLPWDNRTAEKLQGLFSDPANQGQAMMRFEFSWDTSPPQFYPLPQPPALPEKEPPPVVPRLEISTQRSPI